MVHSSNDLYLTMASCSEAGYDGGGQRSPPRLLKPQTLGRANGEQG